MPVRSDAVEAANWARKTTALARVLCAAGLAHACGAGDAAGDEALNDPRWVAFAAARARYLEALAEPILRCVARTDSAHAAFHGCVDWHSAVHGTWALLAISRHTGDPRFAAAAAANLVPSALESELVAIETGRIQVEIPYGYAWFLRLARERALAGDTDLEPLAILIATELEATIAQLTPTQIRRRILDADYDNLSWAVLNLWQWADWTFDTALAARMVTFTRDHLLPVDAACPLEADRAQLEFFPPCLHRARTVLEVLPQGEALAWLSGFAPSPVALRPLEAPANSHQSGQTFSRAWGLWSLWRSSGDIGWLHLYIDHVEGWLAKPEYWAQDYNQYSHWVAQFGVYALDLSAE